MSTRIEKNKVKKKNNFIKFIKFNIIIYLVILMVFSLGIVNEYIINLNIMENPNIFSIDIKNRSVSIMGEEYSIDMYLRPD